jgi:hypothetical protein
MEVTSIVLNVGRMGTIRIGATACMASRAKLLILYRLRVITSGTIGANPIIIPKFKKGKKQFLLLQDN